MPCEEVCMIEDYERSFSFNSSPSIETVGARIVLYGPGGTNVSRSFKLDCFLA